MPWRARAAAALLALAFLPVLTPAPVRAADLLEAPPGAVVTHRAARNPDALSAPLNRHGAAGPLLGRFEGRVLELAWRMPDSPLSTLAVARAQERRLAAQGFRAVLDCAGPECGGFDFRAAAPVLPPPAMALSLGDFRALTMRRDEAGGATSVVAALVSRVGPDVWVQLTAVAGGRPARAAAGLAPALPAAAAPSASAPAAQPAGAASGEDPARRSDDAAAGETDPSALGAALDAAGRVVLEGVAFLPGGAALAPEAGAALDAAAALLLARPGLSVAVVGHTDSAGPLEANMRVARARAATVVEALAARGVPRGRLGAEGAGWLAPRASNATEAGRALNRRVELVAR
jgi:OOP family OmpA-OmpF porin